MKLKGLLFTYAIIISLLAIKTSNAQNEYLISYDTLTTYTPGTFELLLPGLIDQVAENFPISTDSVLTLLDAKYNITLYKILYNAEHPIHGMIQASGAIAIPEVGGSELPLAVYQHGTTFNWDGVPSYMSLEHYLGSVFSASGYVSLMPDYLGLGDSPFMHPYSHGQSTANAGRDMIRAFAELAPELGIVWNEEIFITGYSQGGHGAMALFKALEEDHCDEFKVTACSALSGAYSISGIMEEVMFKQYGHPKYLPYTIVGYQSVYPELFEKFGAPFKEEYGGLNNFTGDTKQFFEILDQYPEPDTPIHYMKKDLVEEFVGNDEHPLKAAMRESDNYDWDATAALFIQGCCDDEQVDIRNAQLAYEAMERRGKLNLQYADYCEIYPEVGTLRHNGCIPYCLLQTKAFFDAQRGSEPVECNPVAIEEQNNEFDYNLYPNPVNSEWANLNISAPVNEAVTISLFNTYGQMVWVKNENLLTTQTKINTEGLANGFYSLNIKSKTYNFTAPFFIAK